MDKVIIIFLLILLTMCGQNVKELSKDDTRESNSIILNPPDLKRGLPVMEAFSRRASSTAFISRKLSPQDLSDLLYAANGINRRDISKRTAPSAQNAQDIDIFIFFEEGVYFYDAQDHVLNPVVDGDHRELFAGSEEVSDIIKAPAIILLVSDMSRFRSSNSEERKLEFATYDAGIVSQNINLFCAGMGLITRPRVSMDNEKIRIILKLKNSQRPMLNNAVGYRNLVGKVKSEVKYRIRDIIK